jgi:hypothetical protein
MSGVVAVGRWASTIACLVIAVSFAMFAADEGREGSQEQIARVDEGAAPTLAASGETKREQAHGATRERIDDVDDALLKPFAGVVGSENKWAMRLVPALLGLLAYGLIFRLLLNYLPK